MAKLGRPSKYKIETIKPREVREYHERDYDLKKVYTAVYNYSYDRIDLGYNRPWFRTMILNHVTDGRILYVYRCKDWQDIEIFEGMKTADSKMERMFFVDARFREFAHYNFDTCWWPESVDAYYSWHGGSLGNKQPGRWDREEERRLAREARAASIALFLEDKGDEVE